ncbi:hypothetical protein GGI12_002816 [Dipsacomyces acuminosporus]|nr:hypothetical protein GGI12_002816 [Dipsacomyces acuminosporus]
MESNNGKEPQADHVLSEDDIISVHADPPAVKPRPPTLTSIPALLSTFQNEWDSLVLEAFTLKQQYQQVRQELSQALYQNDASCRVIARLMKERDEARETLATLQAQISSLEATRAAANSAGRGSYKMDVDGEEGGAAAAAAAEENSLEDMYFEKAAETADRLFKGRVKRKLPSDLTSADKWRTAAQTAVVESLHTSTKPGILSLDLGSSDDLILTTGVDKHTEVYSRSRDQTLATLKGHTKAINAALWVNGGGLGQQIITASDDKSICIWKPNPANTEEGVNIRKIGWSKQRVIKNSPAEVRSLSLHPSGEYFASGSADGTWMIHSTDGEFILKGSADSPISQIAYHPDGRIIGAATTDGLVHIIDVKQRSVISSLDIANADGEQAVAGLHFSENGYYFAAACASSVSVWDLRKQKCVRRWAASDLVSEDEEQQKETFAPFAVVRFDRTGGYLAFSNDKTHIFQVKGWHHLASLSGTDSINDIAWIGDLSTCLVVASTDSSLRFYAPTD